MKTSMLYWSQELLKRLSQTECNSRRMVQLCCRPDRPSNATSSHWRKTDRNRTLSETPACFYNNMFLYLTSPQSRDSRETCCSLKLGVVLWYSSMVFFLLYCSYWLQDALSWTIPEAQSNIFARPGADRYFLLSLRTSKSGQGLGFGEWIHVHSTDCPHQLFSSSVNGLKQKSAWEHFCLSCFLAPPLSVLEVVMKAEKTQSCC